MTANFVDQFGFNDEEFSEHDENINATFDRIAEINFNLDADDNSANAAAFEACCKERIRQFDDAEDEEDIWEEKEMNYATQAKSRTRFGVSQTSEESSRGSMENGGPGWTANFRESGGTAASQTAPGWDSSSRSGAGTQGSGWANFTEFQPFSGTDTEPRCSSPVASDSSAAEKQAKPNQEKSDVSASAADWPVGEGKKAPVVASDSSSSRGSDSEEDDKKLSGAPPTVAVTAETAAVNKTADPKSEESTLSLEKLSLSDPPAADPAVTSHTDRKEETPPPQEVSVNGPV
ncbi:hypothetical protein KUCAC02_034322 [Chaenocephalus aceratus]|nr:hypothetical protein KUCAC02_034322 [Chaenocephalus aceratus]